MAKNTWILRLRSDDRVHHAHISWYINQSINIGKLFASQRLPLHKDTAQTPLGYVLP